MVGQHQKVDNNPSSLLDDLAEHDRMEKEKELGQIDEPHEQNAYSPAKGLERPEVQFASVIPEISEPSTVAVHQPTVQDVPAMKPVQDDAMSTLPQSSEFHPDQPIPKKKEQHPVKEKKQAIQITAAFCDGMVQKYWAMLDPNGEGVLDKIETANLIGMVNQELGLGEIDMEAFDAYFTDFANGADGMVHQAEMASVLRDYVSKHA
jgi:hypothetical protein